MGKSLINVVCACCFVANLLSIPPIKAQSTFSIPVDPGLPGTPATSAADLSKSEETVMMELWGIQISSSDPARLSTVMDQVNREIDETRRAMQYAYEALLVASRGIQINWINSGNKDDINASNLAKIVEDTGERGRPRISLADALFRINMANDASSIYEAKQCDSPNNFVNKNIKCAEIPPSFANQIRTYNKAAEDLCNYFAFDGKRIYAKFNRFEGREQNEYKQRRFVYGDAIPEYRRPFQRFQEIALHQDFPLTSKPKCSDGNIKLLAADDKKSSSQDSPELTKLKQKKLQNLKYEWARRQQTLRKFIVSSGTTTSTQYDRKMLQQFDAMLSPIVVALNRDIEDFFIRPTLYRIKQIVRRDYNVEYAEVGKTTVAGLNGLESKVMSETISSIDEPTPLRLNELLSNAKDSKADLDKLFSTTSTQSIGKTNPSLSGLPIAGLSPVDAKSAVALLAALSKEEVRWRGIPSGTNIKITPTVFEDQTGAKLKIEFTTGSNATKDITEDVGKKLLLSKDNPLRDPSRIIKNTVETEVKVNTWDLFAVSSLNNQTTITGRRWNVPLLGPIWEGIFGDLPVVGNLLSPKAPPLTVHHQNIILVNTLVVPSGNGLAKNLFP